jgi:hypothetical protein
MASNYFPISILDELQEVDWLLDLPGAPLIKTELPAEIAINPINPQPNAAIPDSVDVDFDSLPSPMRGLFSDDGVEDPFEDSPISPDPIGTARDLCDAGWPSSIANNTPEPESQVVPVTLFDLFVTPNSLTWLETIESGPSL